MISQQLKLLKYFVVGENAVKILEKFKDQNVPERYFYHWKARTRSSQVSYKTSWRCLPKFCFGYAASSVAIVLTAIYWTGQVYYPIYKQYAFSKTLKYTRSIRIVASVGWFGGSLNDYGRASTCFAVVRKHV